MEDLRLALREVAPEFYARLHRPWRRPAFLHVNNPAAAGRFAEDITVQPGDGLETWFAWSWGERITPTTNPEIAAQAVVRVLAVENPGGR
ncbi:hypothetical protein ABZ801_34260 [Actinomadura sp. NPDC047616]|uniref:hypothetical protein n=1 Tax=Actinomadura sp. NPDC047616 TaxID=3155914 RepID=UPI003405EFD5